MCSLKDQSANPRVFIGFLGYFALFFLLVLLIPFVWAAFSTFAHGDDFQRALKPHFFLDIFEGFHEMFRAWWKWSGRYAHHFFVVFFGDAASNRFSYSAFTLGYLLFLWYACYGLFKEIGHLRNKGQAILYATVFTLLILCGAGPELWTHYLITNQLGVGLGLILCIYYVWALCLLWNAEILTKKIRWFCLGSAILAAGCYEYATFLVALISAIAFYLAHLYSHRHLRFFKTLFYVSVACFFISYLARGNFRRPLKASSGVVDWATRREQFLAVPYLTLHKVLPVMLGPTSLLACFACFFFVPRWEKGITYKIPGVLFVCIVAILFLLFIIAQVLIHAFGPAPIPNGGAIYKIYPYSLPFFAFLVLGLTSRKQPRVLRPSWVRGCAFLVLPLAIALTTPIKKISAQAVSGQYSLYNSEYQLRLQYLDEQKNKDAIINILQMHPYPFPDDAGLFSDIAKDWPNKYAKGFYSVASLRSVPVSFEDAYAALENKEQRDWNVLPNGIKYLYQPGLLAGPNETYRQDWLFFHDEENSLETVHVALLPSGSLLYSMLQRRFPEEKKREDFLSGMLKEQAWPLGFIENPVMVLGPSSNSGKIKGIPLLGVDAANPNPVHSIALRFFDGTTALLTMRMCLLANNK